ncbi:hypothetical protein DINM_003431 [Dirofilaria immitis]|nr:hypothetical protein [Dirofilaria immitis]
MAGTSVTVSQGKLMTLNELRVFELKQELENALREEGHDPKFTSLWLMIMANLLSLHRKVLVKQVLPTKQREKENLCGQDAVVGVIIESEDNDGSVEKADHLSTTRESSEELMEARK